MWIVKKKKEKLNDLPRVLLENGKETLIFCFIFRFLPILQRVFFKIAFLCAIFACQQTEALAAKGYI